MYNYKTRDEVPEKYKWDLTDFFKNDNEFNELLKETTKEIKKLKNYKGCTKDANKILEFLNLEEKVNANVQLLYVYSYLKNDEILGIKENIERKSTTLDLYNKLEINTIFFEEELLKLNEQEYNKLFKKCEYLKEYEYFLNKIYRKKAHTLNEQEEQIISELTNALDNSSDISSNLLNREHNYGIVTLEDGTTETITINNFSKLMKNKDNNIRKKVYTNFYEKINEYAGTSAGLLNSYIKGNNIIAKLHKFNNAWERKLFDLNLDNKVFETLVSTVENNTNIFQKYFKLTKKILNLEKLHSYDLELKLSRNDKEYTIEEAQNIIKEALKPLGDKYLEKINTIFDKRYIDYIGYKGKCSGGYSFPTKLKDSKILMSYNANVDSISTIIHESGHNVHHSFIIENNLVQYRNISNIVAEVASLTNECLLSNYLMNNVSSKEERLSGIENIIKVIKSNLFGAVREGKIEEEIYEYINEGGTLSKEYLNQLVKKSYEKYQGKEVIYDDLNNASWVTRSHYYMNFYLYSYSISISVAINVANEILKGNKEMLDNYMKFLSTGSNVWPSEAFKILGIDLTDEKVYLNAINYLDELINNFEKIYFEEGE